MRGEKILDLGVTSSQNGEKEGEGKTRHISKRENKPGTAPLLE